MRSTMTTANHKTINSPGTVLIYESPDNGNTVYARLPGSDNRYLVHNHPSIAINTARSRRSNRLLKIMMLSEDDPTLDDALKSLEALYIIKYGHD
jgi:PhoPQ-activated pathogenicity-related protein